MKKCGGTNSNKFGSVRIFSTFLVGLSVLTMAAFGFLTSSVASADDTVIDVINITVPVACTMASSPNEGGTYTATMMNGENKSDFGSTTFSIVCNDSAGFGVYAIGYGNTTLGVTDMISSVNASYNIATGTDTSSSASNWAMKLTPVTGASAPTIVNGFNNFHVVPSAWTKVAEFGQVVASSVGSSFTSTYQVHVSSTQPVGTYTGKVRYTLVHPSTSCVSYTVHFNAGDGSGTMNDQVICVGTSTPLIANTFDPPSSGHEFSKWNTEPDGTGTSYDDGESVTDIAEAGSTLDLYAEWKVRGYTIAYNLNNGTAGANAPTVGAFDANVQISNPTKTVTTRSNMGSSGCTVGNNTSGTQTFAGWTATNVGSGATTGTSSSAVTTSWNGSTNTTNQWFKNLRNDTGTVTMVANWTPVAFNLPAFTSTPAGHTCKWFTNAEMTTPTGGINGGSSYTPTAGSASTVDIYAKAILNQYTCTKRYRLQNADGNFGNYVTESTEQVDYGATCSYAKTIPDYKNTAVGNNNTQVSSSCVVGTSGCTVSLDFYRNTYTLTVNKDSTYIASASASTTPVHGDNYYRWGQAVSISATANADSRFTSWTQSGTTGTFANANSASTTFTMDKGNATVTANGGPAGINLYDAVASKNKGTQTAANLNATISSSNSGVYTYNSSVFGADSDGTKSDNTKATIYYYRGILDNTQGTYGSDGDAAAYPNYVVLSATGTKSTSDTCWRIIRTTGSGGVKMIYNGKWTGSTCANATTNAQLSSTSGFGASTSSNSNGRQIVRVGYTYSSTYASTSYTSNVAFNTVFGSNTVASADSVNNTDSTIKGNVESWYSSNLNAFTSILESNAGYCNDRYAFQTNTGSSAATNVRPYTTSTQSASTSYPYAIYFVGSQRNAQTTRTPSLGCSYNGSRNIVDLYSSDSSAGGNGQLDAPVALLTADEASFAGSGNSNSAANGSYYNAKSYLNTGSNFWTMTPYYRYGSRNSNKLAYNFYMTSNGNITNSRIDTAYGVRPVISLKEGTLATEGTGIATDPWIVPAP